jgi:hypothetical protein
MVRRSGEPAVAEMAVAAGLVKPAGEVLGTEEERAAVAAEVEVPAAVVRADGVVRAEAAQAEPAVRAEVLRLADPAEEGLDKGRGEAEGVPAGR